MTNSRNKGKAGERELAAELRRLGFNARRGQQYSGANGDADVIGVDGLHIECKRTEQFRAHQFMEQARSEAREGELPVVMWRKNRSGWLVIMDLDDFAGLYSHAHLFKEDTCER